jgi:hypothetical protein
VLPGGLLKWNINPSSFTAKEKSQAMADSRTERLSSQEGWGVSKGYYFEGKFHPVTCKGSTEEG